jgi:hypothetical protein
MSQSPSPSPEAGGSAEVAVGFTGDQEQSSDTAVPKLPYGRVVTREGVDEYQYPSTDSAVLGRLAYGVQIGLRCKVTAQSIDGNSVWYQLRDRPTWVTARYVDSIGIVRLCKHF